MLDGARHHLGLGLSALRPEKRLDDQVGHVAYRHMTEKTPQQAEGLKRVVPDFVAEQTSQAGRALGVHRLAGQAGGVDLGALEILVPIVRVVNEAALDVLVPEGGSRGRRTGG